MWNQIDSCLVWPNGKAYIFSGNEYVRYDIKSDRVDSGYPAPIAGNWAGLWSPAGAGVVWPNGKAYFFRGSQYVRYDIKTDRTDSGYPAPIAGNWSGLSLQRIDAGVVWPNGKAYFFGADASGHFGYVRYDVAQDRQDADYPQPVTANWRGLPAAVNACTVWPNGKAYFFFGSEYARYDIPQDRVDPGFPQPIARNWPGIPMAVSAPAHPID
jgi:hemopexin